MHAVMQPVVGLCKQLTAWSNALAAGQIGPIARCLTAECTMQDVNRFLANAIGERERLLQEELSLTALAFVDFTKLVEDYRVQTPRTTFELAANDAARCLQWLRQTQDLTPQQQDFITYQECEYACYRQAQEQRASYLQFQARRRCSTATEARAAILANSRLYLAPVRVLARLTLPGLNPAINTASDVVFFAVDARVQMLCLSSSGLKRLQLLADIGPCTFDVWHAQIKTIDSNELQEMVVGWMIAGLIACEEPTTARTDPQTFNQTD